MSYFASARTGALAAGAAILLSAAAAAPAQADVAGFYKSKKIRVVVGFSPGGGFDAYGRLLARHMGKHIPGNPGFVVNNKAWSKSG